MIELIPEHCKEEKESEGHTWASHLLKPSSQQIQAGIVDWYDRKRTDLSFLKKLMP